MPLGPPPEFMYRPGYELLCDIQQQMILDYGPKLNQGIISAAFTVIIEAANYLRYGMPAVPGYSSMNQFDTLMHWEEQKQKAQEKETKENESRTD